MMKRIKNDESWIYNSKSFLQRETYQINNNYWGFQDKAGRLSWEISIWDQTNSFFKNESIESSFQGSLFLICS